MTKNPTGRLASAYDTIAQLKSRIAELEAKLAQPVEPVAYTKRVIAALYENSDPVSVDGAEELERLFALINQPPVIII